MLSNKGFDLWADNYDRSVQISDENDRYPFAGYKEVLNIIFNEVMQKEESAILDIGFGTAALTSKLYEKGHQVDGVDFSPRMIELARDKMPAANLLEWDITAGLPPQLEGKQYDAIISTYALHHLTDEAKIAFIHEMRSLLKEDGSIFIGDVAFKTRELLEQCRQKHMDEWDEDEFYFVADEMEAALKSEFHPVSHCSGVFVIVK